MNRHSPAVAPRSLRPLMVALYALLSASPGRAQELIESFQPGRPAAEPQTAPEAVPEDLTELDLESLLELECTVVSRQEESIAEVPAAVYVISGEEIRRAGHSSVQEALRMVPGFFVSHWDDTEWDVTSRGFGPGVAQLNLAYLNQLLVMVDGVVVYTPLFAGMRWSLQDMDVEEIERIEVIRGPSGILWGANAFHGLVNIITKHSSKSQGLKVSGRISNEGQFYNLRYGGQASEGWTYRSWLRTARYDGLSTDPSLFEPTETDPSRFGDWGIDSAGAQFDWAGADGKAARIWTRVYNYEERYQEFLFVNPSPGENDAQGGQFGLSYDDPESGSSWRASYLKDRQHYNEIVTEVDIDYLAFEYQRRLEVGPDRSRHFGVGYDLILSNYEFFDGFASDYTKQDNFRAFYAEELRFPEQRLAVSLGLVALQTAFSGFDLQPSLKVSWAPDNLGNFWASLSRAVRTPSIEEKVIYESPGFGNESVVATEIGWRDQVADGLTVDLTAYYNDYDNVRVEFIDPLSSNPALDNSGVGTSKGVELALDYQPTSWWTLRGAASYHRGDHRDTNPDADISDVDGQYPERILNLRSYMDLGSGFELDLASYLVNRFRPDLGSNVWRSDARLGWNPSPELNVSLGVQSFNDAKYAEFPDYQQLRQVFYLHLTWTP